jgi:hypothetical protein
MQNVDIAAKGRKKSKYRLFTNPSMLGKIFRKDLIGNAVVCQIFAGSCDIHPIVLISKVKNIWWIEKNV